MTRRSVLRRGAAEAVVEATPEEVWAVLTDVTRVGEWSHECHNAAWAGDSPAGPVVGARFRGLNKVGLVRWGRVCTVSVAEFPHRFAYRTGGSSVGDCTEWTFALHPVESGTRIVQSFQVLALPRWAEVVICFVVPQHQDRQAALVADLNRLGQLAGERSAAAG